MTWQLSTNGRYLMDPQITQSEVRLNRVLKQRGQIDQQKLEKFQLVGSKSSLHILDFTFVSVKTFISSFQELLEAGNKFATFLRGLLAKEVNGIKRRHSLPFYFSVQQRSQFANQLYVSVGFVKKVEFYNGRHPGPSIQN